jgi:GAF domain-containing protein
MHKSAETLDLESAAALVAGERDPIANAANLAAALFHGCPDLNWAGFYFFRGGELVVGPFQGKPACVRIMLGRGVCGTAAADRRTIVVEDVHAFPGHIACDAASRSEIVVPLFAGEELIGVLDVDSPKLARFGAAERTLIEALAALYVRTSDFTELRLGVPPVLPPV